MLRFFVGHILCVLALLFGLCSVVSAQNVNGFVELRYADYSAERGGATVDERSHFTQQYSLLWEKTNLIQQGRAGSYTLALGAEWTSVNADINDESSDIDTFKLLYKGDLLFAPGGLPFRLHAYSFDTSSASFDNGRYYEAANVSPYLNPGSSILEPDIISDISDGQYIVSGVTLLAGIRNGSYLGQYRDILSRYPRLLMDYREVYARDMDSENPVHYRDRNLAFVSLNKKDNWFHFRTRDYKDFIDGNGDFEEKTILLGTIDHTLERKWINLTNWLELSVDGSFTKTIDSYRDGNESDEFLLNLFSVGTRKDWQVSNFSSYRRLREDNGYFAKNLIVPFYAKGDLSPETSWRSQLIGSWEDESRDSLTSFDRVDNAIYARSQFDLLQRSLYIVQPEIAIELRQGDSGEGAGLDLGVQAFSNYRYRPKNPLYGSIHFSALQGDGAEASGVSYVEIRLVGRAQRVLRPGLMVGAEQRVVLGEGTLDTSVAPRIPVEGGGSLMFSASDDGYEVSEGSILRSTTTLFLEHQSGLLKNRLEAIYDHLTQTGSPDDSENTSGDMFNLRHKLTYDKPQLKVSLNNDFIWGDGHESRYLTSDYIGSGSSYQASQWSFFTGGGLQYFPSRSYEGSVGYQLLTDDNSVTQLRLEQRLAYNLFTVNGRVRKLGSLYQELLYENYSGIENDPAVVVLTVGGNYYPGHYISLGARLDQEYYTDGAFGQMTGRLSADFNFPKLIIGLDYAYGVRDARENYEERTEQRWEVKIKKIL